MKPKKDQLIFTEGEVLLILLAVAGFGLVIVGFIFSFLPNFRPWLPSILSVPGAVLYLSIYFFWLRNKLSGSKNSG